MRCRRPLRPGAVQLWGQRKVNFSTEKRTVILWRALYNTVFRTVIPAARQPVSLLLKASGEIVSARCAAVLCKSVLTFCRVWCILFSNGQRRPALPEENSPWEVPGVSFCFCRKEKRGRHAALFQGGGCSSAKGGHIMQTQARFAPGPAVHRRRGRRGLLFRGPGAGQRPGRLPGRRHGGGVLQRPGRHRRHHERRGNHRPRLQRGRHRLRHAGRLHLHREGRGLPLRYPHEGVPAEGAYHSHRRPVRQLFGGVPGGRHHCGAGHRLGGPLPRGELLRHGDARRAHLPAHHPPAPRPAGPGGGLPGHGGGHLPPAAPGGGVLPPLPGGEGASARLPLLCAAAPTRKIPTSSSMSTTDGQRKAPGGPN